MFLLGTTETGSILQFDEPEAPGLYACVTDEDHNAFADEETGRITIAICQGAGTELASVTLDGRAGLLLWYQQNCGYQPDADNGAAVPMHDLIEMVVGHMLLTRHADDATEALAVRLSTWRLLTPPKAVPPPTIDEARRVLDSLLAVLHPGVVGLIYNEHGAQAGDRASAAVTSARTLSAAIKGSGR